jgi:hypothetical protein
MADEELKHKEKMEYLSPPGRHSAAATVLKNNVAVGSVKIQLP